MGCAQQVAPQGGPKDKEPPQIIADKSSADMQTQYNGTPVILTFDEWIQLNNPSQNIVVSPPLEKKLDIQQKGKSITIRFDKEEILRSNATYTINFGDAIKDYTEGNVKKNFKYVFSTGNFIDSLSVQGKVVDAFSGEPKEDVLVLLYDNLADSVVRTQRPFYFAKTRSDGAFTIENVRADTFKVFALKDNNLNYMYDIAGEGIGFPAQNVIVNDSISLPVLIQFSTPALPLRLQSEELNVRGIAKLIFNQSPEDLVWKTAPEKTYIEHHMAEDTLTIWYIPDTTSGFHIFLQTDTFATYNDTITVSTAEQKKAKRSKMLLRRNSPARINAGQPLVLEFNYPVQSIDTSLIQWKQDTLPLPKNFVITKDSASSRRVFISFSGTKRKSYTFSFFPGAFTNNWHTTHDTTIITTSILSPQDLGTLTVTYKNLNPDENYVAQLLSDKEKVLQQHIYTGDTTVVQAYGTLLPGTYKVTVIQDDNKNERWDAGNYDTYTQPERVLHHTLDALRADWELREEVKVIMD